MKVRFQADADLNHIILLAVLRRAPEVDFQSAVTAQLEGMTDEAVLSIAQREGRVLVSHDQSTMPQHFSAFIQDRSSPGLLIVPQHLPSASIAEELLLIWHATDAEEWINRMCWLPGSLRCLHLRGRAVVTTAGLTIPRAITGSLGAS